jgi:hypothetical protein
MTGPHNIRFSQAQEKYFEKREGKYLREMYVICAELSAVYIAKYAAGRHLSLNVDELSHDSASYVIARYLQKPDFRLNPLSGYLFRCCNSVMWRDKAWDKRKVSFEDWMGTEGE